MAKNKLYPFATKNCGDKEACGAVSAAESKLIVQVVRAAVARTYLTIPPPPPVFSHLPHTRPQPLISPVPTAPSTHWKRVDSQV